MARHDQFTVSGPGENDKLVGSANLGIAAALTFASRAKTESTFYVRDANGDTVGYAERFVGGNIEIRRTK